MATQVQFRRGTTAETAGFTGAVAEVTVDTNKHTCVIHNGSTPGGFPLMREDGTNMALSSGSVTSCAVKFASDPNTGIISPGPDQLSFVTGGVGRLTVDANGAVVFTNNVLIGGTLTLTGSSTSFFAGSAGAPSITFTGDTNTGIYSPGADQLGFSTGGVNRLTLDGSGNISLTGNINIASTKEYQINGVKILDATSLGSSVISSSLTSVGTISTGTWQGTTISHLYGGTGQTSYTSGQLLIGKADGSLAKATLTASTGVTITNGDGTITISATGLGGTVTAVTASTPLSSSGGTAPNITIQDGTTSQKGAVQLTDSTSSTSTTTAATPNSVKTAYDLANAALPKSGGTMTGAILGDDSSSPSTPGYAFDGDPNTGLIRLGADELGLVTGGSTRLSIDASGNITIPGNLTIQGTTTTIDTTTLLIEDKNIEIGVVAVPTNTTADGGGITLKGTTDKTFQWLNATGAWTSSEHINIVSTKEYRIAGTKVLDATSLGSGVVSSSLTSVGTIGTGSWQGSTIATGYGGTGQTTYSSGQLLIGKADGTLAKATLTASTGVTITNGDGTITISATGSGGTVTAVTASSPLASSGGTAPNITIQDGTTSQKGAVQLENSVSSTSTTTAATPSSVKTAYDLAAAAQPKVRAVAAGATSGTITPNADTTDLFVAEGLTGSVTLGVPTGSLLNGQKLLIRLKDNGTARGISWTATTGGYRALGVTLPTTTVLSKITYVGCVYNSADSFWDVVATVTQA